jgi:hypothetical protein
MTTTLTETRIPAKQRLAAERAQFLLAWVLPLAAVGLVSFAGPILNDGDTFWHLAAGRWMIAHGQVPAVDPFSYTFAGQPWVAQEWLSEVLMAGAWQAAGWAGVMLLIGLAMGATTALMLGWMRRWLAPLPAIAALVVGLACVAPSLLARPHILALPAMALWTVGLLDARARAKAPSFWLLPVMILWANLHSSFIVGLGLAAALGLEQALDFKAWRWRTMGLWAVFGLASLGAALLTPHGVDGFAFPLRVMGMKTLPNITEWQGPDFLKLQPLEIAVLAGAFAIFWRGARLTAVRAALVLFLVHLTLQHVRQEVLLGVIAPLLIAEPLGRAVGPPPAASALSARLPWPQLALGAGLFAAIVVLRLASPVTRVDGTTAPVSALAAVPAALIRQPVLNDYDFGGYLIFKGVRPYIDGRADMYGDDFVAEDSQIQLANQADLDGALAKHHIAWSIMAPGRPVVAALTRMGWRQVYADRYAVVQTKP